MIPHVQEEHTAFIIKVEEIHRTSVLKETPDSPEMVVTSHQTT
jgi:hypothetical protein